MSSVLSYFFAPGSGQGIHWSRLELKGADVIDYLHRLTTVNLKTLRPGEGRGGFFLNPQGRIRSYFTLWRVGEAEVTLEFDAGPADGSDESLKKKLLDLIEEFRFSERFTVSEPTLQTCRWFFPSEVSKLVALDPGHALIDEKGIRFFRHADDDFGRPWVSAWGDPKDLDALLEGQAHPIDAATIETWRITACRPWIAHEIDENSNPLEIGLHEGVAQNKGCYPGQEVIEKIISLGSPAKRLIRLRGETAVPERGTHLFAADESQKEAGIITSSCATESGFEALAIVRKVYAAEETVLRFSRSPSEPNPETATVVQVAPYM